MNRRIRAQASIQQQQQQQRLRQRISSSTNSSDAGAMPASASMAGSPYAKQCAHLQWLPEFRPASCAGAVAGFQRPGSQAGEQQVRRPRPPLPDHLKPLLEECRPLYAMLRRHALKPLRACSSSVPRPLAAADGSSGGGAGQAEGAAAGSSGKQRDSSDGKQQHGGTHVYDADPRNADILIGMRDGVTGARTICVVVY
jgi:hypothetical protein